MKNKYSLQFPTTIAAGFILLAPVLQAAITWDAGGGINPNWSTLTNWNPDDADVTGDDVIFNVGGAIASGTTNTVSADASINTLSYSFEDAALQHTTTIASAQTLAVSGSFLLAGIPAAAVATNVTITGATGTLTVGGTSFQVGQTTPTAGTPTNSLDMSGLGTLTANLGTSGVFRLGSNSTNGNGPQTTVKLAATSSITTDILGVADKTGRGASTQTLKLGNVANTINANTIAIGSTNGRGSGNLSFETGTGTLTLRAADGVAAVTTMNMINNSFGHNGTHVAIVDLAGHGVDAKIGALTMARRTGTGSAGSSATLSFNNGTLEVTSVNMAVATNAGMTGPNNATINIGGGLATFGAITMSTNSGGGTTTGILNLTGGTTTINGDIIKGGGTATTTANLTLNGATAVLDMTGDDLTNLTTITYTDGLLKNLGIVNTGMALTGTGSRVFDQGLNISGSIQGAITGTGIGLTKQGSGSLTLTGTNTYDGLTQIDDGALIYGSKAAKAPGTTSTASAGSVGIGVHDSNVSYYSATDVGSLFNSNTLAGFNLDPASGVVLDTSNAGASFTQNVALTAARALTKNGTNTLILPSANAFTGNVTITGIANSNTLRIEHAEALGPIATAKTITSAGDNRHFAILELANNITVDVDKTLNTSGKSFMAAGEIVFGSPVCLRNAAGNNTWLGNIQITAAGGAYAIESAAGTLTLGAPATTSVLRNNVLTSARAFNFLGGGNIVVNSQIVDTDITTSSGINKYGTGTLTLPRTDNQCSVPAANFSVGTTVVENMTASGTPSSIGSGTSFNFGGTFRHVGAANSSSDRPFGLVGSAPTLESSGTGSLALTSTAPVTLVNGTGTPIALFGLGETVITARDAQTLFPGMTIAATGIATGTKIAAVDYNTRQITLDTATTAAQLTNQNATITGSTNLDRNFTLGGTNTGNNLIAAAIGNPSGTGKLSLNKAGTGKWILSGANTYTGNTAVSGGRLALGATNVLPDTSPVSLGTATLDAATVGTEVASTLSIIGAATINLAAGAKIEFADSNGTWSGTLNLTGFVSGSSLKFGTSAAGLSVSQLGQISATGFTGFALNGSGFLTATASGTPYTIWAATFLPADVSNPAGDNDNDGLVNQQEFAFGLSPISGSSINSILVPLDNTTGTFTYQRRAATGLTYKILTSVDLLTWAEDTTATTGQIATPSGSNETVVVTLTGIKPLAATKLFVRVAAQ